jgi:hypothetical protein
MPRLASLVSKQLAGVGITRGNAVGFISTLDYTTENYTYPQPAIDSAGNIVFAGLNRVGGTDDNAIVSKYDSDGILLWSKYIGYPTTDEWSYWVTVDSSDNIIFTGMTFSVGQGLNDMFVVKLNSSGTLQWVRALGGTNTEKGYCVATDALDNIYVVGDTGSQGQGSNDCLLVKFNSSGTVQWQKILGDGGSQTFTKLVIDSSGNIIVSGDQTSTQTLILAKYNSSGTLQWYKTFDGLTDADYNVMSGIDVDSSGNIYCSLNSRLGTGSPKPYRQVLIKCNSSGTVQWARLMQGSETIYSGGVAIDYLGDIVLTSTAVVSGIANVLITKYNSSGTLLYQKTIGNGNSFGSSGTAADSLGNIFCCGTIDGGYAGGGGGVIMRLPSDGSGTMPSPFVYQNSTFTSSAISISVNSSYTYTAASASLTNLTPSSPTITNTGLTSERYLING